MQKKICCVTGHRDLPQKEINRVKAALRMEVEKALTGCFQRFSELSKIRDFRRKRVYVLTNYNSTHEQDLYRVDILRRMGFDPYVMIYERPTAPPITRHLQRWVNNKRIFRTVEHFADYEPVKKLGRDG